jgi:3-oxoacyl-[acyl-carrier-protein] synthase III
MSTATLESVASFLPERSVRIEELGEHLGLRRAELGVFRKFYGLETLRYDPDLALIDLLRPAAARALDALPPQARVDYVVYAHTTQTLAPPDVEMAQVIRDELGLAGAEAFGLSQQACASSLGAIDVVAELLRSAADDGGYALVVTGERAFSPIVQLVPNTTIMADGAGACLVTLDGAGDAVRSFVTRTFGEYAEWTRLAPADSRQFAESYGARLADVIRAAVAEAGLEFDDIDQVIPHNVKCSPGGRRSRPWTRRRIGSSWTTSRATATPSPRTCSSTTPPCVTPACSSTAGGTCWPRSASAPPSARW